MSEWQNKSDPEINRAVAIHIFNPIKIFSRGDAACLMLDALHGKYFDPCNKPSDAWPIMESNGIAPLSEGGKLVGAANDSYEAYEPHGNIIHSVYDKNPLRAAMIVYLEMNGVKP